MFLYPDSLLSDNYLSKAGAGITIRVLEALASLRLLKLCRYYEGASLLAMAVGKSLKQLSVPLFMLLIMVFCFASSAPCARPRGCTPLDGTRAPPHPRVQSESADLSVPTVGRSCRLPRQSSTRSSS